MASAIGVPGSEKYKSATVGNPYLASVVQVDGRGPLGGGEGTGWSVQSTANKVFIITNNHVIKGFNEFSVTYQFEAFGSLTRKVSKDVKIIGKDPANDLALLEVGTEHEIKPLPLRATTEGLVLPMKLTMIGHPHGLDFTVMWGELDNLNRVYEGSRHLQINSNADCGMSGGPVIDENGFVIGVTVAKLGSLGQSIAIISERVRDLCAKYGINLELKKAGPPAAK
ncbi:MAG: serine protease [Planctomycetota bacterium]